MSTTAPLCFYCGGAATIFTLYFNGVRVNRHRCAKNACIDQFHNETGKLATGASCETEQLTAAGGS